MKAISPEELELEKKLDRLVERETRRLRATFLYNNNNKMLDVVDVKDNPLMKEVSSPINLSHEKWQVFFRKQGVLDQSIFEYYLKRKISDKAKINDKEAAFILTEILHDVIDNGLFDLENGNKTHKIDYHHYNIELINSHACLINKFEVKPLSMKYIMDDKYEKHSLFHKATMRDEYVYGGSNYNAIDLIEDLLFNASGGAYLF